jgi:hypothetical protein
MFLSKTFNLDNVTFKLLKIVNVLFNDENTRHKILPSPKLLEIVNFFPMTKITLIK